jgi:hypothetical protein
MKKYIILFLLGTLLFSCKEKVKAEESKSKKESPEICVCNFKTFKSSLDGFILSIKNNKIDKILKVVQLPLPGSEYIVKRFNNKGITKKELEKNYKELFNKPILEKLITLRKSQVKITEAEGKCSVKVTLMFQTDEYESMRMFEFELVGGNLKLLKIVAAG